jgi:hypothetical protein
MRLFGTILLAGLASLIAGIALTAFLSAVLPCYSDKAGCGLGEVYRLFFVPVEVLIGMIVFSLAAFGKNREHPVRRTMLTMVMVAVFLMLFAWGSDITSGNFSLRGIVESVEVLAAVIVVIVVQWLIIRTRLRA